MNYNPSPEHITKHAALKSDIDLGYQIKFNALNIVDTSN